MKLALFFTLSLLTTSLAFADIKIEKSKFDGHALELPAGFVQILNPSIRIGEVTFNLVSGNNTAGAVCKSIKMKYVSHQEIDDKELGLVSFDRGTSMIINYDEPYYTLLSVTCKK